MSNDFYKPSSWHSLQTHECLHELIYEHSSGGTRLSVDFPTAPNASDYHFASQGLTRHEHCHPPSIDSFRFMDNLVTALNDQAENPQNLSVISIAPKFSAQRNADHVVGNIQEWHKNAFIEWAVVRITPISLLQDSLDVLQWSAQEQALASVMQILPSILRDIVELPKADSNSAEIINLAEARKRPREGSQSPPPQYPLPGA